jgi:hypothetical protein
MNLTHRPSFLRDALLALTLLLVPLAAGCAAQANVPSAPKSAAYNYESAPPPPPPASPGMANYGQGEASGASPSMQPREAPKAEASDRPGLATHWGEARTSHIHSTSFTRASGDSPSAVATLWYNDREGSRAMAASEGYRSNDRGEVGMAQSGITVSLRDSDGRMLPGYQAGGKTFAIGEAGTRYTIVIRNNTPARFEIVASVDGLDVMDGRPASFSKRGYLVNPHDSLEIDGFRTSENEVAAFRFGSVRGSYADKKGDDRNVGVIGIALFHERGFPMWPWDEREIEQRRNANPFPGRFASPPLTREREPGGRFPLMPAGGGTRGNEGAGGENQMPSPALTAAPSRAPRARRRSTTSSVASSIERPARSTETAPGSKGSSSAMAQVAAAAREVRATRTRRPASASTRAVAETAAGCASSRR